ncbi:MAG: NAD-glutamate dehydrogenase [Gemmatimonadota bacterium]
MPQAPFDKSTLDELIALLQAARPEASRGAIAELTRRLMSRGSAEFLAMETREEVVDTVSRLYGLVDGTAPGDVGVRTAWDPADPNRAVLQTVMDDCPFIVDTIREYVHALGLHIPHLMHPVVVIERGEDGRITEVRERAADGLKTSIVHMSIEGHLENSVRAKLDDELRARLRQVTAVTQDFSAMVERARAVVAELASHRDETEWRAAELDEIQELLRWMIDSGFVFLGYRGYTIEPDASGIDHIRVDAGAGLGILRDDENSRYATPTPVDDLPPELRARLLGGPTLIFSKTNAESPIRRRAQMDYIGIKRLGPDGTVRGEHRFLGLLTAKAFNQDASAIPILRRKFREILELEGAPRGSHDYNIILQTFNSMPKEELFLSTVEEIRAVIDAVMETEGADDVRVTSRPDSLGRGYNVMVILPKNRFSAAVRRKLQRALTETYDGKLLNYHLALGQGDQARLHFYVSHDPKRPEPEPAELEVVVRETVRTWEEKLDYALIEAHGPIRAQELGDGFRERFSSEYQAAFRVSTAVDDIDHLDALERSGAQQASVRALGELRPKVYRLKIFAHKGQFVLSDVIPTLENLGFRVLDAYRFTIGEEAEPLSPMTIHVFEVEVARVLDADIEAAEARLADALRAVREGEAEDDQLNSLLLSADLTWEQIGVLRAYSGYAFRIGAVVSRQGSMRPLTSYPRSARLLFEMFESRFDPAFEGDREKAWRRLHRRFASSLRVVRGIEDDRTLRRLMTLVHATQRTNYYRGDLRASPTISLKFDCRAVDFMPEPRPRHEVYLRGARTEAAHLRMDDVARGGIRWSDRYEDFRVEVLGLVKTQRVKNAVIAPAGAKGAFIAKRLPAERAARLAAGLESYKEFIRGLLEISDNVVEDVVIHPERVVVHDGPDPYLVVAADKGTAKNSDTANALAEEVGFWLDDAFASGGSNGYDHKAEGITARGTWECVKRHFRESGLDFENDTFTVVGIGDMSGDVFGNGMLLSRKLRLLAAFDHRHIFLDPDPDPTSSWEERARLFALPTSSWSDYDAALISEGGGVFERTSKEIPLADEVRTVLDVKDDVLNGEELIRAILRAPVDLLWNGGIGTYVKATNEAHADVGDPSNDGVRVDATEVRARVIGEGGNLGLTQPARIEYARGGGRVNTDALDNSAGVDMSDHEVNLKILLGAALTRGTLEREARNDVLRACADEVSAAVLSNNYTQSLAISLDERRSRSSVAQFRAAIDRMEREEVLDPVLEHLPNGDELMARDPATRLTRPELAIVLAHAKLHLKTLLQRSRIPSDPAMLELLREYFPDRALEVVTDDDLENHRLRPHLVSTLLANRYVDRMGAASHIGLMGETDRAAATVARSWFVANVIADADDLYSAIRTVDATVRTGTQYQWYLEMSESLERATSWLLNSSLTTGPIAASIDALRTPVREVRAALPRLLSGERLEAFQSQCALHEMDGLDPETARSLATFLYLDELLPIASLVGQTGADTEGVGGIYLGLAEEIDFPWVRRRLDALTNGDVWTQRSARILIGRLEGARLRIAATILDGARDDSVDSVLERFRHAHAVDLTRIHAVISDIRSTEECPQLASLLVAVEAVADARLSASKQ